MLDRVVSYGNWTEGRAAGVVRQLLDILKTVHSNNMVHMDVKVSLSVLVRMRVLWWQTRDATHL